MTEKLPIEADVTLFRAQMPKKRRQSRRQRCDLATMAKLQIPGVADTPTVWVYNVSLGGVGLNAPCYIDSGLEVMINFRLADRKVASVPAKTVFCMAEADNSWRVGCEFDSPLTQDILEAIIG